MIKGLLVACLAAIQLSGAALLNQNLYERQNRVDLMLSFDSVYTGSIKKRQNGDAVAILLEGATAESEYKKELTHPFLQSIAITPSQNGAAKILFLPNKPIEVQAAKTTDGYGLRLRVVADAGKPAKSPAPADTASPNSAQNDSALGLDTKDPVQLSPAYMLTVGGLLLIALVLFIAKRKVAKSGQNWLMPQKGGRKKDMPAFEVRFQKVIDPKNKVVLMEYEGREYLTVIGTSNILLDVFENGAVAKRSEFEQMFEKHKEELNDYIRVGHDKDAGKGYSDEDSFTANAERV